MLWAKPLYQFDLQPLVDNINDLIALDYFSDFANIFNCVQRTVLF